MTNGTLRQGSQAGVVPVVPIEKKGTVVPFYIERKCNFSVMCLPKNYRSKYVQPPLSRPFFQKSWLMQ